jgi:hypothetical protein
VALETTEPSKSPSLSLMISTRRTLPPPTSVDGETKSLSSSESVLIVREEVKWLRKGRTEGCLGL